MYSMFDILFSVIIFNILRCLVPIYHTSKFKQYCNMLPNLLPDDQTPQLVQRQLPALPRQLRQQEHQHGFRLAHFLPFVSRIYIIFRIALTYRIFSLSKCVLTSMLYLLQYNSIIQSITTRVNVHEDNMQPLCQVSN